QLVFDLNDDARVVSGVFQVVNDYALDFRAERRQQMRHQIMSKGTLFGDVTHEHCDSAADGLIDVDDENLLSVAKDNRASPAGGSNCPHLHLEYRLVHRVNSTWAKRKNKLCTRRSSSITCVIRGPTKIFARQA